MLAWGRFLFVWALPRHFLSILLVALVTTLSFSFAGNSWVTPFYFDALSLSFENHTQEFISLFPTNTRLSPQLTPPFLFSQIQLHLHTLFLSIGVIHDVRNYINNNGKSTNVTYQIHTPGVSQQCAPPSLISSHNGVMFYLPHYNLKFDTKTQ